MINPIISIILPIYKVEEYLNQCVNSIVNQTYRNLEIILVDDGSPDECPRMCDKWAEKDNRIKVIHKENGGLSDARNAGMKIATGDYISFIDSDDYISLDFFETLYNVAITQNADIVECSIVDCYEDGRIDEYEDDAGIVSFNTEEALSGLIAENPFHQHVWNKLYLSSIALAVPFAVGKLNEDEFWTYQVFGQAKRVAKINKTMYFYLQRSGSIMGEGYNIRRLDALEGKANRQRYIEDYFPNLEVQSRLDMFGSCIFAYQCILKYLAGAEKKEAKRIVLSYKKEFTPSFSDIKTADSSSRKWYVLAKNNFSLCCMIKAGLNIGF